ncbi:hypothetical protein H2200_013115 [Cladophialophora chaetospira]|uniref:Uncharacterized protein n=1 Tax=Cladophialophora chaetospira TaxID=386627 RepID=A0AA38WW65_9EURO|nr:hypothetical protein H2200_013115 [Cladophialophora chaetospira]
MAAPVVSVPADEDFVLINAGILPVITEAEGDVVQESAAPTHTIHATAAIITAPAEWKPSFPPFASGFLDAFPDKPSILPNPNEELFWVGTTMPTSTPTPTPTHSVHGILDPFLPAVDAEPTPAPTPAHHDIIHDIFDPFLPAVDEQGHISASNEKYVVTEDTPALPILEETGSKYVVSEGMPPLKSLPPGTVRIASKED